MNVAAGPELAAAVTNHGGIGVIGGVGYTPKMLKENIDKIKYRNSRVAVSSAPRDYAFPLGRSHLNDKNAPFGVDLLLPQVRQAHLPNLSRTSSHLARVLHARVFCSRPGWRKRTQDEHRLHRR